MRNSTTIDKEIFKWPVCLMLALLLVLQALPVMATEQQTEQNQTPTVTEVTGSESAESVASGENNETITDGLEPIDLQEAATTSNSDWTITKPHEGEVLNGGYVGFKNKASEKYLTIPNGATATGTNVCQQGANSIANAQEFYLNYVYDISRRNACFYISILTSTGGYSGMYLNWTDLQDNSNVNIQQFMPTIFKDRWQIEHVEGNYYCIYAGKNPDETGSVKYALTVCGNSEGSLDGTEYDSPGNVYITTYTGADNQLWQICADGIPIDINGYEVSDIQSVDMLQNSTLALYYVPQTFNEKITLMLSNPYCATIEELSNIIADSFGHTVLHVSVLKQNINTTSYGISLYVKLPDGVYYLNSQYNHYNMDVEGGGIKNNTNIQVWNSGLSEPTNVNQLFKFIYLGEGAYCIRTMTNNELTISWMNSGKVVGHIIGTTDADVPDTSKWRINSNQHGIYIYSIGSVSETITVPIDSQNGTELILDEYSSEKSNQCWNILPITNIVNKISVTSGNQDLVAQAYYEIKTQFVSSYPEINNDLPVTITVLSGEDVVEHISNTTTIYTKKPGEARIRVSVFSLSPYIYCYKEITITVFPTPYEAEYVLQNGKTGAAMAYDPTEYLSLPTMDIFTNEDTFIWELCYHSNGLYKIIPKGTNLSLGVDLTNNSITITSIESANNLWKVVRLDNGRYKLIYNDLTTESNELVLSSYNSIGPSSLYLTAYIDDGNYSDEWDFLVAGSDLFLLTIADPDRNRSASGLNIQEIVSENNHDCNLIITDALNKKSLLMGMKYSDVFISRSHGGANTNPEGTLIVSHHDKSEQLTTEVIFDYSTMTANVDLSNCSLLVFIGCETGASQTQSLPQAAVAAGADSAIGFREPIAVNRGGEWAEYFISYYYTDHSVHESIIYALESLTDYGGVDSCRLIFGYSDITYSDIIE